MNNLIEHAKREFLALGYRPTDDEDIDDYKRWIQRDILELLRLFSEQEHSGTSAAYCIKLFAKLAMFEPLAPLSGDDGEWAEVAPGVFQNKRCSRVFKEPNKYSGQAYDIEGRIFRDSDGYCYINILSHVLVTFPYTPTTEYVDVADGG